MTQKILVHNLFFRQLVLCLTSSHPIEILGGRKHGSSPPQRLCHLNLRPSQQTILAAGGYAFICYNCHAKYNNVGTVEFFYKYDYIAWKTCGDGITKASQQSIAFFYRNHPNLKTISLGPTKVSKLQSKDQSENQKIFALTSDLRHRYNPLLYDISNNMLWPSVQSRRTICLCFCRTGTSELILA